MRVAYDDCNPAFNLQTTSPNNSMPTPPHVVLFTMAGIAASGVLAGIVLVMYSHVHKDTFGTINMAFWIWDIGLLIGSVVIIAFGIAAIILAVCACCILDMDLEEIQQHLDTQQPPQQNIQSHRSKT